MVGDSPRRGILFRGLRGLLLLLAGLTLVSFLVSASGIYFWFNVGAENRLRFEYGRLVWRHVQGGTARTYAGVDGGAAKIEWAFERQGDASRSATRIPLWMPFLLFAGSAVCLTVLRSGSARPPVPDARGPDLRG